MDVWEKIYEQIHEHHRDALRRRDQVIAFYLVLLAALIGALDKLGEFQDVAVAGSWIVGLACFAVITQYWRWQIVHHASFVTIHCLLTSNRNPSIDECKHIWNTVNDTNTTIMDLMKPCRGVEINIIYLFAFMTSVPFYMLLQLTGFGILKIESGVLAFLLDAIVYTLSLSLLSSWYVTQYFKFDEKVWIFRWLRVETKANIKVEDSKPCAHSAAQGNNDANLRVHSDAPEDGA